MANKEINIVKNKLIKSIRLSRWSIAKEGFETNKERETWMDTSADGNDTRDGVRLEIQALRLSIYRFAYELTKNKIYNKERRFLK